jgi:hypothetical protein
MRNERLTAIEKELGTIRQRLTELQGELIAELRTELTTIKMATFNATNAETALAEIAALLDTAK